MQNLLIVGRTTNETLIGLHNCFLFATKSNHLCLWTMECAYGAEYGPADSMNMTVVHD
jgi:hypothetical protein